MKNGTKLTSVFASIGTDLAAHGAAGNLLTT